MEANPAIATAAFHHRTTRRPRADYLCIEDARAAASRVNVDALVKTLRSLEHMYPYHQAIGFYMEAAGVPETELAKVQKMKMRLDFHLANRLDSPKFSRRWRVHYPPDL